MVRSWQSCFISHWPLVLSCHSCHVEFSLDPSYRRSRVYKLKFCLFVCFYVITSTFPIWRLQIIPKSCQTPHIIHHWKEDDINDENDKDTHKDQYKWKTMTKTKCLKDPSYAIFSKSREFKDINGAHLVTTWWPISPGTWLCSPRGWVFSRSTRNF